MKPSRIVSAILAMLCVGWISIGHLSAQSIPLSTQQLTLQSDVVAVGTVSATQCEWNANKTRINTRVTIAVREFLKGGGVEQQITVLTPGGEIGDVGELYCGAARFQKDEEVVVFAKKQTGPAMQVAGGAMGKFTIERDKATQVLITAPGMTLDNLRTQVRSAAQAPVPEEK
jgi:hypothetical protein